MQVTRRHTGTAAVWADALFVSVLQRSDKPDAGQVRQAIATAVRAYGDRGCAQRVAQEFGDHPETAVARMHWARAIASTMQARRRGPRTAAPQPAVTASGRNSCSGNTRNNFYQSEHDRLIAFLPNEMTRMTLTCKWSKDQIGDLVIKWTGGEVPVMKPEMRKPAKESTYA